MHFLHTDEMKLCYKLSVFIIISDVSDASSSAFLSSFCTVAHNIVSYHYNWGTTCPPVLDVESLHNQRDFVTRRIDKTLFLRGNT